MRLLARSAARELVRHPVQTGLCVLGIAIGVAVVLSIDLAVSASERAFQASLDAVNGRATHQVAGGPAGVPDAVYRDLRVVHGFRRIAPVVEADVSMVAPEGGGFRLLGVDPWAERPFRSFTDQGSDGSFPLVRFLTEPGAIVLSAAAARDLDIGSGDRVGILAGGHRREAAVVGLLDPGDAVSRSAVERLIVCDVATAQELTGREGRLTRIDVAAPQDAVATGWLGRLEEALPAGCSLLPVELRGRDLAGVFEAFELNLGFLSLLAIVVGAFLIYNTMTFSVLRRREALGRLRARGVTERELLSAVLGEALLLAAVGTAGGLLLGRFMADALAELVGTTINDLYFASPAADVALDAASLVKVVALGIGTTLLAAAFPAREAARCPPRVATLRSAVEARAVRRSARLALVGVACAVSGGGVLAITSRSIAACYLALLLVVLGFALASPLATRWTVRALAPVLGRVFGPRGRMAARSVVTSLSRTGVAVAALAIALSMAFGVDVMISSFRGSVDDWLGEVLAADVYVSPPRSVTREQGDATLDPAVVAAVSSAPGVASVSTNRSVDVESPEGPVRLVALGLGPGDALRYRFSGGDPDVARRAFGAGSGVLVSEPLAWRRDLDAGDALTLRTPTGPVGFSVAGVFRDYASDRGYVVVSRALYRRHWRDDSVSALAVFLEPGSRPAGAVPAILARTDRLQRLDVRSQETVRDVSLAVFDRTFRVTGVLRVLAGVVAFIGVLSALMSLQLERVRELGTLRARGVTSRELWGLVAGQTTIMGLVAGIQALPLGAAFAAILTGDVNRRSFGWSLDVRFTAAPFLATLLVAVVAALLAGAWPAWRMSRIPPAQALRAE